MSTRTPQVILRLCEKLRVATQLPTLKFVEPEASYVISISPVTYPVTTLIKMHDRKVGALGYREIYGQEIAVVLCFHIMPFTIDADPRSLDRFASVVGDYFKAVDVALRLERVGIPYAEHLYRSFGVKPIGGISATTDTVFYLNSFTDYDGVPVGGYFSIVGYSEPVVKVYRRVAKRYPHDR